jgi:tRNA (guanine-N7-)-methyltransferase
MSPNGYINLKTDSPDLYDFTKKVIELYGLSLIEDIPDLNKIENLPDDLKIKTHYENLDISGSQKIHYLRFALNMPLPLEKDTILQEWVRLEPIKAIPKYPS